MLHTFLRYRDSLRHSPFGQKEWTRNYRALMQIDRTVLPRMQCLRLEKLIVRAANAYPPVGK